MSINVLVDLLSITLESLTNKYVIIKDLDNNSNYNKILRIKTNKGQIKELKECLDYFITHPTEYKISELIPDEDFNAFLKDCTELSHDLKRYC